MQQGKLKRFGPVLIFEQAVGKLKPSWLKMAVFRKKVWGEWVNNYVSTYH